MSGSTVAKALILVLNEYLNYMIAQKDHDYVYLDSAITFLEQPLRVPNAAQQYQSLFSNT